MTVYERSYIKKSRVFCFIIECLYLACHVQGHWPGYLNQSLGTIAFSPIGPVSQVSQLPLMFLLFSMEYHHPCTPASGAQSLDGAGEAHLPHFCILEILQLYQFRVRLLTVGQRLPNVTQSVPGSIKLKNKYILLEYQFSSLFSNWKYVFNHKRTIISKNKIQSQHTILSQTQDTFIILFICDCHRSSWELPIIFQRTVHYIILKSPGMLPGDGNRKNLGIFVNFKVP